MHAEEKSWEVAIVSLLQRLVRNLVTDVICYQFSIFFPFSCVLLQLNA